MKVSEFNKMMQAIKKDCHDTGMDHWLVPKIAATIQKHIKVIAEEESHCTCQGYYKPPTCPIHGTHKR